MNNLQCRKAYVRVNLDVDEEGTMVADKKPYLEACEAAKTVLTDTSAIDTEMEELRREMEVVVGLTKKCIEENSTAAQNQEEYAA